MTDEYEAPECLDPECEFHGEFPGGGLGGFTAKQLEALTEPSEAAATCRYCRHPLTDEQERRWGICGSCHDDGTPTP